jgi:hypothetical protein
MRDPSITRDGLYPLLATLHCLSVLFNKPSLCSLAMEHILGPAGGRDPSNNQLSPWELYYVNGEREVSESGRQSGWLAGCKSMSHAVSVRSMCVAGRQTDLAVAAAKRG